MLKIPYLYMTYDNRPHGFISPRTILKFIWGELSLLQTEVCHPPQTLAFIALRRHGTDLTPFSFEANLLKFIICKLAGMRKEQKKEKTGNI